MVHALVEENRARGAEPDGWGLLPNYEHDVPYREIGAPAFEALEAAYEE